MKHRNSEECLMLRTWNGSNTKISGLVQGQIHRNLDPLLWSNIPRLYYRYNWADSSLPTNNVTWVCGLNANISNQRNLKWISYFRVVIGNKHLQIRCVVQLVSIMHINGFQFDISVHVQLGCWVWLGFNEHSLYPEYKSRRPGHQSNSKSEIKHGKII